MARKTRSVVLVAQRAEGYFPVTELAELADLPRGTNFADALELYGVSFRDVPFGDGKRAVRVFSLEDTKKYQKEKYPNGRWTGGRGSIPVDKAVALHEQLPVEVPEPAEEKAVETVVPSWDQPTQTLLLAQQLETLRQIAAGIADVVKALSPAQEEVTR